MIWVAVIAFMKCECSLTSVRTASTHLLLLTSQACLPFLSSSQPHALQQAASDALTAAATVDADAVWLLLTDILVSSGNSSSISSSTTSNPLSSHPITASQYPPSPPFPPLHTLLRPLQPSPGLTHLPTSSSPTSTLTRTQQSHRSYNQPHRTSPLPSNFSLTSPAVPWVLNCTLAAECAPKAVALLAQMEGAGHSAAREASNVDAGTAESNGVLGRESVGSIYMPIPLAILVGGPLG